MTYQLSYAVTRPGWHQRFLPSEQPGLVSWLSSRLGAAIVAPVAIAIAGGALSVLIGPLIAFPLAFIGIGTLASAVRSVMRRRGYTVLSYVEQAVRLNQPLPTMLLAAAQSEHGATARLLYSLSDYLLSGAPLGPALEVTVKELPLRTVRLIHIAEQAGRLKPVLHRLVLEHRKRAADASSNQTFTVAYPLFLSAMVATVLSMVLYFVMPKFEFLMKDFGIPLPLATRTTIAIARFSAPWVALILVAIISIIVGQWIWDILFRRRNTSPSNSVLDLIAWHTPLLGQLQRNRSLADVFFHLAESAKAGEPLHRSMIELQALPINGILKSRLIRWAQAIERGESAAAAARSVRLPPLIAGILSTASSQPADACEFVARYYDGRFSRLALLLQESIAPATAIVFGAVVCWIALAFYMPIVRISYHLMDMSGGAL